MRFIQVMMAIFAVTSRLVSLAIAKPVPKWEAGGISIPLTRHSSLNFNKSIDFRDAVSSHGISLGEKVRSALDNYEMNTGNIHPFAINWSESRLGARGASVRLTTSLNTLWMSEISIGTPPKTLNVHIDTASADMWVLETGCIGISTNRDLWNPFESDSSVYEGKPFQLKYADGCVVEGARFTDNVTIGGFTADPQAFGAATLFSSSLSEKIEIEHHADGLLGLAFPSISKLGVDTLFRSFSRQGTIRNPIFSLKLTSSGAEMYVGEANSMLYNGDITYTPVTNPGFWQVSMNDVRANDHPILKDVPAILDTGANYIYGDWDQVSELYGRIGGKLVEYSGYGLYYLPCDSFPTMSFTFSGTTFELPPAHLILNPVREGSPNCFSAIVGRRAGFGFWNVGLPFLQSVYSVFDYNNLRVGIAKLA